MSDETRTTEHNVTPKLQSTLLFLLFQALWLASAALVFNACYAIGEWISVRTHVDIVTEIMKLASWRVAWLIVLSAPVLAGISGTYAWKRMSGACAWLVVVAIHLAVAFLFLSLLLAAFAVVLRVLCFAG